jgi:type II secretory pathway component PulK
MILKPPRTNRNGVLVVCVLVCIGVATTIMSLSIANAIRARRGVRKIQQLRQTEYLLDAGVLRSAEHLKRSADYRGEKWQPETMTIHHLNPTVLITVEQNEDPTKLLVTVVATLQDNGNQDSGSSHRTIKRTHQYDYLLD